jgi:hypothetical protein
MPKQTELKIVGKGVSPVHIPELDKLAEAYVAERDKRLRQTPKEVAAKTKLIDALHKHSDKLITPDGDYIYRYDEMLITLSPGKEKLRVASVELEEQHSEQ